MVIIEFIQSKIYEFQGHKIMFDFDLAELYDVETRTLKQAVRRNIHRFPSDFLIVLSKKDWKKLITTCDNLPETKAILVNIAIMRAFVFIRQYALSHKDLTDKCKHYSRYFEYNGTLPISRMFEITKRKYLRSCH
jgi:hypothetical protein